MSCNIVNYLTFLTGKIQLDLMDSILLGIILFPLSIGFGLICRTWAFLITHNRPLGRADWVFILHHGLESQRLECLNGHAQRIGPFSWAGVIKPECFNGHVSPLGFSEWACEPIFQTLSDNKKNYFIFSTLTNK